MNAAENDKWFLHIKKMLKPEDMDLITTFSLTPYAIVFLLNELLINKRTSLIEFGSGLSTILLAQAIKGKKLDATLLSIENDAYWLDKIKAKVNKNGLSSIVQFVYAPVFPFPKLGANNKWYDIALLEKAISTDSKFDMVLVDGPPAYLPQIELSRYNALPFVRKYLTDQYSVFLDDAGRRGEQTVLSLWEKELGIHFDVFNHRLAAHWKGNYQDTFPGCKRCITNLIR